MFSDTPENGKTKAENIEIVRAYLERVPELYPPMRASEVGTAIPGEAPDLPEGACPLFGDLVQIADFDTAEDAAGYPPSKAHMDLVALSDPMLSSIAAIDFEVRSGKSGDRAYIEEQARKLGVTIAGKLRRSEENEASTLEKCFADEEGKIFRLRHGILTVVDADGKVY